MQCRFRAPLLVFFLLFLILPLAAQSDRALYLDPSQPTDARVDDLIKLKAACEDDRIAGLKGFGAKSQQKILEGLAFIGSAGQRVRIDQALDIALPLLEAMIPARTASSMAVSR